MTKGVAASIIQFFFSQEYKDVLIELCEQDFVPFQEINEHNNLTTCYQNSFKGNSPTRISSALHNKVK